MLDEDTIIRIYAEELVASEPGKTMWSAVREIQETLFDNAAAKKALLNITRKVWLASQPKPLTTAQRVAIAQRAITSDVFDVMSIIEETEQAILEQYHEEQNEQVGG